MSCPHRGLGGDALSMARLREQGRYLDHSHPSTTADQIQPGITVSGPFIPEPMEVMASWEWCDWLRLAGALRQSAQFTESQPMLSSTSCLSLSLYRYHRYRLSFLSAGRPGPLRLNRSGWKVQLGKQKQA